MTSPKPRRTQSRPLAPEGRAQTVQTSLSPSQAAWVASRGVPVAAYLRGLVEADQCNHVGPGCKIEYWGELGHVTRTDGKTAWVTWENDPLSNQTAVVAECRVVEPAKWTTLKVGDRVRCFGERGTVRSVNVETASVLFDGCTAECLEDLSDLVKIGGDV